MQCSMSRCGASAAVLDTASKSCQHAWVMSKSHTMSSGGASVAVSEEMPPASTMLGSVLQNGDTQ